MKIIPKCTYLR